MSGIDRIALQHTHTQGNKLQRSHVIDDAMQHTASHNVAHGRGPILGLFVRVHIDGAIARSFIFMSGMDAIAAHTHFLCCPAHATKCWIHLGKRGSNALAAVRDGSLSSSSASLVAKADPQSGEGGDNTCSLLGQIGRARHHLDRHDGRGQSQARRHSGACTCSKGVQLVVASLGSLRLGSRCQDPQAPQAPRAHACPNSSAASFVAHH